jgi:acetylornithine/N-succinyldiaminopimelate aminotransferase
LNQNKWQKLESEIFMKTFNRTPVTLVKGEGSWVWDDNGKKYLDFVAGWAVNCLGHCPPTVVEAIQKQAKTLIQTSNQFYTIPQLEMSQLLIDNSCLDRIFISNSGAEANEGAVKLARRYGKIKLDGAYEIITANGSFHGRTLAMVAATGQHKFQNPYTPLPEGFINVEYNSIIAIQKAIGKQTVGVFLEPIQGEGGVNVPSDNYLKEVEQLCKEKGILFMLDEIQTGIGRTGKLFAYEHYGVEPDIMTLAKGLGSGVPIGAFLAKEHVSVFTPGDHGSTFAGNPLVCAAAYATLKYIFDNNILENVNRVGSYLTGQLETLRNKFDIITDIRGRGLLIALQFKDDIAEEVVASCVDNGLLLNRVKPNTIRFMPPLIVNEKEIDTAIGILTSAIKQKVK